MKLLPLLLLALSLLPAPGFTAPAEEDDRSTIHTTCCEPPTRWAARHDPRDARLAITTSDGDATLLLTEEVVALQLSERCMRRIERKLRHEEREERGDAEDGALARTIKSAVFSGVRAMLDHSAECPLRRVSDVAYRRGTLIVTTDEGEALFEDVDLNDRNVMRGFSPVDAQSFVREFQRLKARRR